MPTNAARRTQQDASFNFQSQKSSRTRPPVHTAPVGRTITEPRESRQSLANFLTTVDGTVTEQQHQVHKKWSCDVCQRVFDDFQIATRHEDACKLKRRLQKLDDRRSQQRSSGSEKSATTITDTTVTNAYDNQVGVSPVVWEVPKDEPISVPRTIQVHNSFRQRLQRQHHMQPEIEKSISSSFVSPSYSNAHSKNGFGSNQVSYAVGYSAGAGYRPRQKSRPVYTTYQAPPASSYTKRDAGLRNEKQSRWDVAGQSNNSVPRQSYRMEDARDDTSSIQDNYHHQPLHTTRMPKSTDVRVIGHHRFEHHSDAIATSHATWEGEVEANEHDPPPEKSMKWLCDVCKEAQFENYVEAFRHEMDCRKKFFLEEQKRESVMAYSEPDPFLADMRAQRREQIKQKLYEKSRSIYSKIESVPAASSPPVMGGASDGLGHNHNQIKGEGTKKWLCSICKQQYFEHYLDACRHEKQCVQIHQQQQQQQQQLQLQQQQQQQQSYQRMTIPRPTLKERRERYV
ncbi:hypothetical protein IV203_013009 [Nitzschia inconspicua]|uniref:Uncharacterized protein n=1 Tax=Nitzschia inconspicua TaxID=303405 RepID=A0A9K3M4W2_9STRA|nr:hypothetical protein IV203_013009 [Nitzschia inconspicua]